MFANLATRGVKEMLVACCDGLTGFPEVIEATWSLATVQTCVVQVIRDAMRFVTFKDRKQVARAITPIYTAPDAATARSEWVTFRECELFSTSLTFLPTATGWRRQPWIRNDGVVRKDDLSVGKTYALRTSDSNVEDPFTQVTFVGPARSRQARVRYVEGELVGLEEWVPTRLLACPWGQRRAVLRDERRSHELDSADEDLWDRVTEDAISEVMTASGEYAGFSRRWSTDPASAQRFWDRAGLQGSPLDDHPMNYQDRHGQWNLSFSTALKASQAFAAAEPDLVDLYVRGWEDRLRAEGFEPGGRHNHELLREWAPRHALARSWTQRPLGQAAEEEVRRLHGLVMTAARYLREAGVEDKARRIERGLSGQ